MGLFYIAIVLTVLIYASGAPLPFRIFFGLFFLIFAGFSFGVSYASFLPSNWVLRASQQGLYVKYRSYLNRGMPEADPCVLFLTWNEIAAARLETENQAQRQGQRTTTQRLKHLVLALRGPDSQKILEKFEEEIARVKQLRSSYRHHPVLVSPEYNALYLVWRSAHTCLTPGLSSVLKRLSDRTTVDFEAKPMPMSGEKTRPYDKPFRSASPKPVLAFLVLLATGSASLIWFSSRGKPDFMPGSLQSVLARRHSAPRPGADTTPAIPKQQHQPCGIELRSLSQNSGRPGDTFQIIGTWGEVQGTKMVCINRGGRNLLEVVSWDPSRITARIPPGLKPGEYSVGVYCNDPLDPKFTGSYSSGWAPFTIQ